MTNVMKKVSALLLTAAMAVTMMPMLAITAFAGENADQPIDQFQVCVNGVSTGKTITRTWMKQNAEDPQVFSYVAEQGKTWKYSVAKGPSYENVLKEGLGIESLDDIIHANINWNATALQSTGKYDLHVSQLKNANHNYHLEGNNSQGGAFEVINPGTPFDDNYFDVKTVLMDSNEDVVPVVAYEENNTYDNYDDACKALKGTWRKTGGYQKNIAAYIGAIDNTDESKVKASGKVNPNVFNFTGKFAVKNQSMLNVVLPVSGMSISKSTLSFDSKSTQKIDIVVENEELTSVEKELLKNSIVWSSDNNSVATVDANGTVSVVGVGSCNITATVNEQTTEPKGGKQAGVIKEKVIGTCSVTVNDSAFTPSNAANLKLKNIKKKSMVVSWNAAVGADGYLVYRSTKKNKGYKLVGTVSGGNAVKYTDKKLKKWKKYYYKVQSVAVSNGKTIYGGFTGYKSKRVVK